MLDTVVIYVDDVCCSVVFGTLLDVFCVMWSELLMTSAITISCSLWSSARTVVKLCTLGVCFRGEVWFPES